MPVSPRRPSTVAAITLAFALTTASLDAAGAADVEIVADTPSVNLDTFSGTTARINPGVTVGPSSSAITATLRAWSVTNDGAITGGNAVRLDQGGTFLNASGSSVTGSLTGMTFGYLPNGQPPAGGPGTLDNYGTISGSVEGVTMWFGGTVNNYSGGTIKTETGLNAVSIGQGASRALFNSGTIQATRTTGFSTGVLMQGGPSTLSNTSTGVIYGDYNGVYGSASAVFTSLSNAGAISSSRGPAVEATGGGAITNSGTITSANSDGILTRSTASAEIINSGAISGAVNAINFTASGGGSVGATHTLRLRTGSVLNGNVLGGAGTDNLILEGSGSETIAKFKNFETLSMQGVDWTLSGDGTFTTGATVQGGLLRVNAQLTSPVITVQSGGMLGGTGTIVGATTIASGGTIAPGNSIGTLNLTGLVTFAPGSVYQVEANAAGQADKIAATGAVTINGGTVQVLAGAGNYAPATTYTILTASGGRTGIFTGVSSNLAFLAPSLTYDPSSVYLTLTRNSIDFAAIGGTRNQRAAGSGVEGLGFGHPIYDAVLQLDAPSARAAFDAVSGEIHATKDTVLIEDSRFVREAALNRLLEAFDGVGAVATPSLSGTNDVQPAGGAGAPIWAQGFGAWGHWGGNGNAAPFGRDIGGIFVGADGEVTDNWRLGLLAGYSRSTLGVPARGSSASSDDYHLGVYGGAQWGDLALRSGLAYTWHDITVSRAVTFPGFSDTLESAYQAGIAQAFGEIGYRREIGDHAHGYFAFEPFANLAYVDMHTDGFGESGGAAALWGLPTNVNTTFATIGLRGAVDLPLDNLKLTARGMLAWRHALGETTPIAAMRFSGGTSFDIAGTPMARDAAVVEAGLNVALTPRAQMGLSYDAILGSRVNDQSLRGTLTFRF